MNAGTRLATLVDDSQMTLTQYFSYAYEDQVYVGMEAGISVASLMRTFEGTVTEIKKVDRVTTEGTRCFAVTVTVENPGALTKGMSGAGYLAADAYVKNGDMISIDIPAYSITLEVSEEELAERKKTMPILKKEGLKGCLARYAQQVSSADKGAIINKF